MKLKSYDFEPIASSPLPLLYHLLVRFRCKSENPESLRVRITVWCQCEKCKAMNTKVECLCCVERSKVIKLYFFIVRSYIFLKQEIYACSFF